MSEDLIALPPIVIDNGSDSDTIKAGFARESEPRAIFASVLGRAHQASETQSIYVGREAQLQCDTVAMVRPIERGVVRDWDAMEKIWHPTTQSTTSCASRLSSTQCC
jgi:actin-related protein